MIALIAMGISGVVGLALLYTSTRMEENGSKSTLKWYGAANAFVALALLGALFLFSSHDVNDPPVIAGIIMFSACTTASIGSIRAYTQRRRQGE